MTTDEDDCETDAVISTSEHRVKSTAGGRQNSPHCHADSPSGSRGSRSRLIFDQKVTRLIHEFSFKPARVIAPERASTAHNLQS